MMVRYAKQNIKYFAFCNRNGSFDVFWPNKGLFQTKVVKFDP